MRYDYDTIEVVVWFNQDDDQRLARPPLPHRPEPLVPQRPTVSRAVSDCMSASQRLGAVVRSLANLLKGSDA
jgi:hypothetical protein